MSPQEQEDKGPSPEETQTDSDSSLEAADASPKNEKATDDKSSFSGEKSPDAAAVTETNSESEVAAPEEGSTDPAPDHLETDILETQQEEQQAQQTKETAVPVNSETNDESQSHVLEPVDQGADNNPKKILQELEKEYKSEKEKNTPEPQVENISSDQGSSSSQQDETPPQSQSESLTPDDLVTEAMHELDDLIHKIKEQL